MTNPWIKDFPLLTQTNTNGKRLVYLDNAATTQKPQSVIEAEAYYYRKQNANPHRGSYDLSVEATLLLDHVRNQTKEYFHVSQKGEIIFTKNASESLNLVAYSYGLEHIKQGDEIVVAISEHHSNLVPWQMVARRTGAALTYLYLDPQGRLTNEEAAAKITKKTKLVAVAHVSNMLGTIHPIEEIIAIAHKVGAVVVVDGTQGAPHLPVNLEKMDADFYAFSAHKMLGPMGLGILYGKKEYLEEMPPFLYGGDMIDYVEEQSSTFAPLPEKFEAGTQNMGSVAGFGAALTYLQNIGRDTLRSNEEALTGYLYEELQTVPKLHLVGPATIENRIGVIPFVLEEVHPHDIATVLNKDQVAIRAGNHCAQPLHQFLGVPATCRASVYLYNTKEDIDELVNSLKQVGRWFSYGTR